jgi:hypothetical protein
MAQQVNVPYFTVNQYGKLTQAGQMVVSIPDGTVSWSAVTGKPETFPPETHTHPELLLNNTGVGFSLINSQPGSILKDLLVGVGISVTDSGDSLTISSSIPVHPFLLIGA